MAAVTTARIRPRKPSSSVGSTGAGAGVGGGTGAEVGGRTGPGAGAGVGGWMGASSHGSAWHSTLRAENAEKAKISTIKVEAKAASVLTQTSFESSDSLRQLH